MIVSHYKQGKKKKTSIGMGPKNLCLLVRDYLFAKNLARKGAEGVTNIVHDIFPLKKRRRGHIVPPPVTYLRITVQIHVRAR